MKWLESAIAAVSPETAARRERARMRMAAFRSARAMYDGASTSHRTAGWRRVSTDANAETMGGALQRLRDQSRDMVRNNPHAAKAAAAIQHNVIGSGIIPSFLGPDGKADKEAEAAARAHLDTTSIDAAGQLDFYGIQSLAMRAVFEGGEVLLRRRRRKSEDNLPLPFQIQVLEGDFLDSSKDGPQDNGTYAVQGVEFDALGRRVNYWLFDEHPGGRGTYRLPTSHRVAASEIAHVYRIDRPGQVRGVPWLAPSMLGLADYGDYADAQRMRQKIAACYAVFEVDANGEGGGGGTPLLRDGAASTQPALEELSPGIYERLPPGRDIKFATPPGVEGYADMSRISLREIAAGVNIPAFVISGDLSDLNFSSGRLGFMDFQRAVTSYQNDMAIGQMCRTVERWFREALAVSRGIGRPIKAIWTPPRREMINPTEEIAAARDAVRAGIDTPYDMVRKAGKDPEAHFAEMQKALALIDSLGIVLDCDPRRVSRAGLTQVRTDGTQYPKVEE